MTVDGYELSRRERETSSDFTRVTTEVTVYGDGQTGKGEDVTYDAEDHDALQDVRDPFAIDGSYDFDSFSSRLESLDLFPGDGPIRPISTSFRRWAFESAALDLALRQAGTDLGARLDLPYRPVRFVVSTRLGDPSTFDRIGQIMSINSECEFKLDPTPDWSDSLIESLVDVDRVRILDFKGRYDPNEVAVANPPDPSLYRRILTAFPDAIVEDPADTENIRPLLADNTSRISWDYPIRDVEDVSSLPEKPGAINIKPSRFGSVEALFDTIMYCRNEGIPLYGGGQFELGVGRRQIQTLASLFYPGGPNDVAPREYNDPDPSPPLPSSPLDPSPDRAGFRRM